MSEKLIGANIAPSELEQLFQDRKVFESFLLMLLYNDLLEDNPLVQKKLFLFVENYMSVAKKLSVTYNDDHDKILSGMNIREKELDRFFLELWYAGLYGYPFLSKEKTKDFFTQAISDSKISSADLCRGNFVFFLREKFVWAKDSMKASAFDWGIVLRHIHSNPEFVAELRKKLLPLAEAKRANFIETLKEKSFPIPGKKGNTWSSKVAEIIR